MFFSEVFYFTQQGIQCSFVCIFGVDFAKCRYREFFSKQMLDQFRKKNNVVCNYQFMRIKFHFIKILLFLFFFNCNKKEDIIYQFDYDYIYEEFPKELIKYDLEKINDSISKRKTYYKNNLIRTDTLLTKNNESNIIGWTLFNDTIRSSKSQRLVEFFRFKNNILKSNQLIVKENDTINNSQSFFYRLYPNKIVFNLPKEVKLSKNSNNDIRFFLVDKLENDSINIHNLLNQKDVPLNQLNIYQKSKYSEVEYLLNSNIKDLKGIFVYYEYDPKTFNIIGHSLLYVKR